MGSALPHRCGGDDAHGRARVLEALLGAAQALGRPLHPLPAAATGISARGLRLLSLDPLAAPRRPRRSAAGMAGPRGLLAENRRGFPGDARGAAPVRALAPAPVFPAHRA